MRYGAAIGSLKVQTYGSGDLSVGFLQTNAAVVLDLLLSSKSTHPKSSGISKRKVGNGASQLVKWVVTNDDISNDSSRNNATACKTSSMTSYVNYKPEKPSPWRPELESLPTKKRLDDLFLMWRMCDSERQYRSPTFDISTWIELGAC